ncbi:MAG: hypothetical protein VYC82_06670, partial [Verrucomicrobiota bacterium]|nr:hypothetical protein [Verrucomicrobiota bacterium]
ELPGEIPKGRENRLDPPNSVVGGESNASILPVRIDKENRTVVALRAVPCKTRSLSYHFWGYGLPRRIPHLRE